MPMNEPPVGPVSVPPPFGHVTADDYDRLALAFDKVATSLDELSVEFTRSRTNARVTAFLVGFLLIVVLIVVAASWNISRSNGQVIDRVDSCTTPGGQCYEDNLRRSNERVAPIVSLICNATPPERRKPPCT